MEFRIKFNKGKQREFLNLVIQRLNCLSLRGILQFGFEVSYDCLKNYHCERRLMNKDFFDNLCHVAKINKKELKFEIINGNYGQIIGGRKSKR